MLTKILIWCLKNKRIKPTSRALILNYLLESVQALPFKDVFTFDLQGTVKVRGKSVEPQDMVRLQQGAVALQDNSTYKLIKEQIAYEAVKMGVHSSLSVEQVLMSKAALWIQQQEIRLIKELAGEDN